MHALKTRETPKPVIQPRSKAVELAKQFMNRYPRVMAKLAE